MRSTLKWFLNCVIVGGVVLALWPLGQTAFARYNQRELAQEFEKTPPKIKSQPTNQRTNKPTPVIAKWPLTKLSIPDLGLETYVVQGWSEASLRRGPGHFERSALPGAGNCVIAGHRNVYDSPFAEVDKLLPGASVALSNRDGVWVYVVDSVSMASASDFSVIQSPAPGQKPLLTLITCTVPHTPNRVIVRATLKN